MWGVRESNGIADLTANNALGHFFGIFPAFYVNDCGKVPMSVDVAAEHQHGVEATVDGRTPQRQILNTGGTDLTINDSADQVEPPSPSDAGDKRLTQLARCLLNAAPKGIAKM